MQVGEEGAYVEGVFELRVPVNDAGINDLEGAEDIAVGGDVVPFVNGTFEECALAEN